MRHALPFKPLTTALTVTALFSLSHGAMAADSYGIDASKANQTVTDRTEIKDVDYGIYVSKGHTADVSSPTDLTIATKKAATNISKGSDQGGTIRLTADNTLTVTTTTENAGRALKVETSAYNPTDTGITAQAKNVFLTVNSSTKNKAYAGYGIEVAGKSNASAPNKSDSFVNVTAQDLIAITTDAEKYAGGISVAGSDSSTTLTSNRLTINTQQNSKDKKGYAHGILVELNGLVDINATDSVDIRVAKRGNGEAFGLKLEAGPNWEKFSDRISTIDIQADRITINTSAETDGSNQTSAVYLLGGRGKSDGYNGPGKGMITLTAKTIDLSAADSQASGVSVVTGGTVTLGDETTDDIRIYSAFDKESDLGGSVNRFTGLYAAGWDTNNASSITARSKTIGITAEAQTAAVGLMAGSNSIVTLGGSGTETVDIRAVATGTDAGTRAYGVWVLNTEMVGQNKKEILQSKGGQADIQGKHLRISAEGAGDVRGVFVASNLLEPTRKATLTLTADTIDITATSTATDGKATGISAMSSGVVTLSGDTTIKADQAILARGDAAVTINKDGKHSTRIDGDIVFSYDHDTSKTNVNANVDLTLVGADSYWNGNTAITWKGLTGGSNDHPDVLAVTDMTLTLKDGAQWTPKTIVGTDPSAENGRHGVALNHLAMDQGVVNIVDNTVEVKVDNLTGTGTVKLATDLSAEEGSETGTFTVGSAAKDAAIDVKLMDKANEKPLTSDELTPEDAKRLMTGVSGEGLAVTTTVNEGMYKPGFGIDAQGTAQTAPVNTVMQTGLELAAAAPLAIHRMLTTDVRKRLGDIRACNGLSGAWARYDGGRLSSSNGLENDFHTVQVGVDTQPTADPVRLGAAFSYTKGDTDYARGTADTDAYSLAAYGLWLDDAGRFVDVVARVATMQTDMAIDVVKKGTLDSLALGLSGEFGWRFHLTQGFYVEPLVEVAYTHVNADDLKLSDGSGYAYDSVKSFVGRAGATVGLVLPDHTGSVYARLAAVHEFLGDAAVTGRDGSVQTLDGKDTWVEYGLGANVSLTKSAYLWADLERTSGGVLDEDYRATFGIRYAW